MTRTQHPVRPLPIVAVLLIAGVVTALPFAWSATQSSSIAEAQGRLHSPSHSEPASPEQAAFAPSRAVQVYIPSSNPDFVIDTSVEALGGCRSVIDPPRNGPQVGGVSPHRLRPAGHVVARPRRARRPLQHEAGHRLQPALSAGVGPDRSDGLRTHPRLGRPLARIPVEHTDTPQQDELPYLTSVWGGDGSWTAGRLVLVTCQQNEDGTPATANFVAVAQFVDLA